MKAVLLAAGKSLRMWPLAQKKNKCMLEFLGMPLIFHTVDGLKQAGVKEFVIVVSPTDDSIKEYFGDGRKFKVKIEYAVQKKPLGTGDALLCAEKFIEGDFVVCNATNAEAGFAVVLEVSRGGEYIVGVRVENPEIYGAIKQDKKGNLIKIEEKPKKSEDNLVSCTTFMLKKDFFSYLKKEKGEYSLVDAVNNYCKKNKLKTVEVVRHLSLKYPWHVLDVNRFFLNGIRRTISRKARIGRNVSISGNVVIEDGAVVEDNVVIKGPCYIGRNSIVRSGCLLREYTSLGKDVLLGYGTETKNTVIYNGTKTHTNYVGDSVIDENVRLGCGTITANRRNDRKNITSVVKGEKIDTGTTFFGTVIGANTHTGINCSIMPGVKIGAECVIGPASVVFDDVPDKSKMYSKFENIVKKRNE